MKVLVINAGSSSLKYQLMDMENESVIAKGICERIGMDGSCIKHSTQSGGNFVAEEPMVDHTAAFLQVKNALLDAKHGVISSLDEVSAIGHRIVQGGALFSESVLITDEVLAGIESLIPLAPLHNPGHVQAIKASIGVFGTALPQVAVFDTAFHSTMPQKAFIYPVPYEYYEKYQIRRYGFHGTSHYYVSHMLAKALGKNIEDTKLITCHIGNGSSITAVSGGKVIDTSMGLTPLDGFMMGSRSGALDPSVVTFIAEKENISPEQMSDLLNKKSGLLGVSGVSSDDRDVCAAEEAGNPRAKLAHEILFYQIAKFIGSYYVALGGCDGIVFTAGLGENQEPLRRKVCEYIACLGVDLDVDANIKFNHVGGEITKPGSKIRVFIIPTDEELVIARDTKRIVEG
ncbi:MAG: acetate kinase [Oscillospiraceae bacterium]|nr:acetate kinase [Oscillospiraceae bacterium]